MFSTYNGSMSAEYSHFYAESSLRDLPIFHKIQAICPELKWIDDYQTFRMNGIAQEKKCLIYARKRGPWLKPFHCYQQESGFEYFSLDIAEGCPFECVYCYLQSYLNHGALVLFVNLDDLKDELQQRVSQNMWISTGLLSDSLISESRFPVLSEISNLLPDGAILELRTKSDEIGILNAPGINPAQIVISWSLNPEQIAQQYEFRAAPLNARLEAARKTIALGYRVGFHFDPVFYFEGWEEAYAELFKSIQEFPRKKIAFLSVGLFRYMPELGATIRDRFPHHPILSGEFVADSDGKFHYFREIRKEMYSSFSEWLTYWNSCTPVFWSMEPDQRLLPQRESVAL